MAAWVPPFQYGDKSPKQSPSSSFNSQTYPGTLAIELGFKWIVSGNEFKLVQANTALTAAAVAGLMLADAGTTAKTHLVGAAAATGSSRDTWAGVGSTAQIALNANDFFLVQTDGRATMIAAAAGTTTHLPVIIGATAGQVAVDGTTPSTPTSSALQVGIAHATQTTGLQLEVELFEVT
jgi:hypothetical protein